jgi:methylthioribulose 1-phosphate dehydratase/enolase-phosphatase E1
LQLLGTTTPITFVKDVLFPYSSQHLESYISNSLDSLETKQILTDLHTQHSEDIRDGRLDSHSTVSNFESLMAYVQAMIAADRKVPVLKKLQGLVWKQGYATGALLAHVYDDVPPFLRSMQDRGVAVCIYSSGSRGAQQLLFKHTNFGDLRSYLNVYFDTTVGQKRAVKSYQEILLSLGYTETPSEVLFVTDILEEAVAAKEAGMRAVLSLRPGNAVLPVAAVHGFTEITTFDQLSSA